MSPSYGAASEGFGDVTLGGTSMCDPLRRLGGMKMECRLSRITVHYESFGSGRPLVVLPGWPDDWTVPADYLEPIFVTEPGWRRIYLDLPGRGLTRGAPWITTNDQVLDIVLEVIDSVIPGERFVIAGHSAGGYLARAVLHRRIEMVDGLLQVVPVIDPEDEDVPDPTTIVADEALVQRMEAEVGPETAARLAASMVVQSATVYERVKPLLPRMGAHDADFLATLVERLSFDVDRLVTPFARPALFLLGRQDAIVGYQAALGLTDAYPRATMAVLDRAGHGLPWEQQELVRALVAEWLMRVEQEA
jgi:pimeloyl-ACP methyl ester carboxylesterase